MISTLTDQLVVFLTSLLGGRVDKARPVRVLEGGAGTGGTTKRLAAALASAGISARYTFTDISPSLVAKAKNTLKQHPWMEYPTFNLEKAAPEHQLRARHVGPGGVVPPAARDADAGRHHHAVRGHAGH